MTAGPLQQELQRAKSWTCLVGPRGAGKSVFARYAVTHDPDRAHAWSLRAALRGAIGPLRVRPPSRAFSFDPRTGEHRTAALSAELSKVERSRELTLMTPEPHPHAARTFDLSLFDVPGGWAARDGGQRAEAVRLVLARTKRFVLFVPFWALLPREYLATRTLPVLGEAVWATSLGAGALGSPDPALLQKAVDVVEHELRAWVEALFSWAPAGADVFVALSQMQPETFVPLFDDFGEELGRRTWATWNDALGETSSPASRIALHRFVQRIAHCDALGRRLLFDTREVARRAGRWNDHSVCGSLLRLLGDDAPGVWAEQRARAKICVRGLLPLNVIGVRGEGKYTWHQHGGGVDLLELRMCEDLLGWLLLHAHAHALWRA